jgi:glycosyltransferase involved in cell wall biosynthesis
MLAERPDLTVIVPTIGRPSLMATLNSIACQEGSKRVEVIVVPDTHGREVDPIPERALDGPLHAYKWLPHDAGMNCWGHPQRNYAMQFARGRFICSLDDDDTWAPMALDHIITRVTDRTDGVHIFRMRYIPTGDELWRWPYMRLGNIGTPMMVVANDRRLGEWGSIYEGDYSFLVSTVANYGSEDSILWHDPVIALIQPRVGP